MPDKIGSLKIGDMAVRFEELIGPCFEKHYQNDPEMSELFQKICMVIADNQIWNNDFVDCLIATAKRLALPLRVLHQDPNSSNACRDHIKEPLLDLLGSLSSRPLPSPPIPQNAA